MNLMLHGIDSPRYFYQDTLSKSFTVQVSNLRNWLRPSEANCFRRARQPRFLVPVASSRTPLCGSGSLRSWH